MILIQCTYKRGSSLGAAFSFNHDPTTLNQTRPDMVVNQGGRIVTVVTTAISETHIIANIYTGEIYIEHVVYDVKFAFQNCFYL